MSLAKARADRLIHHTIPQWLTSVSLFCRNSSSYFYWVLALLLTLFIAVVTLLQTDIASADGTTYDQIMQWRWKTPVPADDIVILDIDEKSLAEMAPKYGRWPWKRDVLAHALAELEHAEPKAILFTVMITDPDTEHPRSDATLSYVASESFVTVYPLIRLPVANDPYSKLSPCQLTPAGVNKCRPGGNVAVILPGLPGMQHDLAINNHTLDDDGILRRWQLRWKEDDWDMPTMVGGALALAQVQPGIEPFEPYLLNWRSGDKKYQRVSFSDYIATLNGDAKIDPSMFAGKYVIIGSSAQGLTVKSSTSVGLQDDVDVLANALDDAVHGTDLRSPPSYIIPGISIVLIWFLAYMFMYGRSQSFLDSLFVILEGGAIVVMALAVNYSTYYVDMMPLLKYWFIYYSVARVHSGLAKSIQRGAPAYLERIAERKQLDTVGVTAFIDDTKQVLPTQRELMELQSRYSEAEIFIAYDAFSARQAFEEVNALSAMMVVAAGANIKGIMEDVSALLRGNGMRDEVSEIFEVPAQVKQDGKLFSKFIAMQGLGVMAGIPLYKPATPQDSEAADLASAPDDRE